MRPVRIGCLWLLLILLGAALLGAALLHRQRQQRAAALDRTLNQEDALLPPWLHRQRPCRPPSTRERRQDEAMAALAPLFASHRTNAALQYVVRYFAWHWSVIAPDALDAPTRCPPAGYHYARIGPILERADWLAPAQERSDLPLIERLPPSRYIAQRLAVKAFYPHPLTHGPLGYDNRPYLRMLLAYQGSHARPWGERALAGISGDSKLGTSAAFLAVATVPDRALPRVAAAMHRLTEEAVARQVEVSGIEPSGRGFTIRDGNRLRELAYALSAVGPRAQPYARPLIALLDHTFGAGSHFGLLLHHPTDLCAVARHIGGPASAAADRKPYCRATQPDAR